jgi:hypothetical protein
MLQQLVTDLPQQRALKQRAFEARMEAFIQQWAPEESYSRARFDMELIQLVREIYNDAQQPVLEQLGKLVSFELPTKSLLASEPPTPAR